MVQCVISVEQHSFAFDLSLKSFAHLCIFSRKRKRKNEKTTTVSCRLSFRIERKTRKIVRSKPKRYRAREGSTLLRCGFCWALEKCRRRLQARLWANRSNIHLFIFWHRFKSSANFTYLPSKRNCDYFLFLCLRSFRMEILLVFYFFNRFFWYLYFIYDLWKGSIIKNCQSVWWNWHWIIIIIIMIQVFKVFKSLGICKNSYA